MVAPDAVYRGMCRQQLSHPLLSHPLLSHPLLLIALALVLAPGCRKDPAPPASGEEDAGSSAANPAPAPVEPPPDDDGEAGAVSEEDEVRAQVLARGTDLIADPGRFEFGPTGKHLVVLAWNTDQTDALIIVEGGGRVHRVGPLQADGRAQLAEIAAIAPCQRDDDPEAELCIVAQLDALGTTHEGTVRREVVLDWSGGSFGVSTRRDLQSSE